MNIIKDNTYILNLESCYIYKAKIENGEYRTDVKKKDKDGNETDINKFSRDILYSATIPYSLETIRAERNYINEWERIDGKWYTKLFINVNFTKPYKVDGKVEKDKLGIRQDLYVNGFILDGVKYKMFKRGGSKARTASAIFIKEYAYDELFNRCLLGLKFEENELCDLTSKNAYISLIMSGIIGTINIKKEEILIIDDVMGKKMRVRASVTERNSNNEIVVNEYDDYEVQNNMTDGQGLLDESVFERYEITRGHSVALLRQDFTKCACFNTKLQAYYKEHNIIKVYDMFRGWVDSKDIKLVITPSACKFLKFSNKFESKKECYLHWWNNIDDVFGVVKTDHIGNYGYANRLSYQMINSLELNYDEVKEIAKDEIEYITKLKNNCLRRKNINNSSSKEKKKLKEVFEDMTYFMNYIGNNAPDKLTGDMLQDILSVNSDFRFTKKFKDYKSKMIENYVADVKTGKIRIKNSLYAILFSCPETMLRQTTQKEMVTDCISTGWEVYCPRYKDKQELCMIRNPQINSGNIGYVTNTYHDEYKWFNLSEFVVCLNTYDVDVMNRLQGCDFDIDSALLIPHKVIVEKAKECQKYPTPINGIKGSIELKRDNMLELANLDHYLGSSTRTIGQIVNKSAICNAYMWNAISHKENPERIQKFYEASSMLSSFSQIAIDMAKKSFLDNEGKRMSLIMEMQKINKWEVDGKPILEFEEDTIKNVKEEEVKIKKMIVPEFFNVIADGSYRITRHFDCGMDYLQEIMTVKELGKTLGTKLLEFKDILVKQKDLEGNVAKTQIPTILEIISKCNSTVNWTKTSSCMEQFGDNARYIISSRAKIKAINNLKEMKIATKTIMLILKRAFRVIEEKTDKKFSDMAMLTLTLLYKSKPDLVLKCFKSSNIMEDKILVEDENGTEDIFGTKYIIMKKKDLSLN